MSAMHICNVIKSRILIAVYAYAYEVHNQSIVPDCEYDEISKKVEEDIKVATLRPDLDKFYQENFSADTGMWVHKHPELSKIRWIYSRYYANK